MYFKNEFIESNDQTHDTERLFKELKQKINIGEIQQKAVNFCKNEPSDKFSVFIRENSDALPVFFKRLEGLVDKYSHLYFFKEYILNDFKLDDFENTAFKYPTNSINVDLDYLAILSRIDEKHIREILTDIELLKKINFSLCFIIRLTHRNWE